MRLFMVFLLLGLAGPICAGTELFPVPAEMAAKSQVPTRPVTPDKDEDDEPDLNTGVNGPVSISFWVHPLFLCYGFSPFGMYFGMGMEVAVRVQKEIFVFGRYGIFASPFSQRPADVPPPPSALAGSVDFNTSGGYIASTGVRYRPIVWRRGAICVDLAACFAHFAGSRGFRGTTSLGGEFFFGAEFGTDHFRIVIETGFDLLAGLPPANNRGFLDNGRSQGSVGAMVTICRASFRVYIG